MQERTQMVTLAALRGEETVSDPIGTKLLRLTRESVASLHAQDAASAPLEPVFARLNGEHPGWLLQPVVMDGVPRFPVEDHGQTYAAERSVLSEKMARELRALPERGEYLPALLDILWRCGSVLPSRARCVSVYEERRLTAAMAACYSEYARGDAPFPKMTENCFLLYTADFSGIQSFIYTVAIKNALRTLRSRSFFLELTMEHYIDELLAQVGVSRANLLYSGGGHCYLLLPNTSSVEQMLAQWNRRFNDWLLSEFGTRLYLADGWTPCSAQSLSNQPTEDAPYEAIFRRASEAVSEKKLRRYTPTQLRTLNKMPASDGARECRICGSHSRLTESTDGVTLCPWCATFERISRKIQTCDLIFVEEDTENADFTLPILHGSVGFRFKEKSSVGEKPARSYLRCYAKNHYPNGLHSCIRIFVGDYAAETQLEKLAQASDGIARIAVCRMDVDDLGQSFVGGFRHIHSGTLALTAAFSRQLSRFFKCDINALLSGEAEGKTALQVAVVYSGGDDVFLVGAWADVLTAAQRIRAAFRRYTCGTLSISGGIALFDARYPIRLAAEKTAELEDEAKHLPRKNGISLFTANGRHVYPWDIYETKVLGEKVALLERFFSSESQERGNAFLYRMLALLRESDEQKGKGIAIARLAYLLARMEPKRDAPAWELYGAFSRKIYDWALLPQERRELITAIYIFAYRNRKVRDADAESLRKTNASGAAQGGEASGGLH